MLKIKDLKSRFTNFNFREKRSNLFKVLVPFFHEDGDMYDIFVEESPIDSSYLRISDYGLTLMKLSYTFDLDTPKKEEILESIVIQNRGKIDNGNIYFDISYDSFEVGISQMIQIIAKVSNMDIINRETAKSFFYDLLEEFFDNNCSKFNFQSKYNPCDDSELIVDYFIPNKGRPLFIYGVNDDNKASKVVIANLQFKNKAIPHRSLVIPENIDKLSKFNRKQIINTSDKLYSDFDEFTKSGVKYIESELSA